MKKKKVLAMLMTLTLTASMCPLTAFAANIPADAVKTENTEEIAGTEGTSAESVIDAVGAGTEQTGAFVLMNIPYNDFYTSEMKSNNETDVDACSSASLTVVYNGEHGRGSYRVEDTENNTTDIHGITFPVWVDDISQLELLGGKEIKADAVEDIKVASHRGGVQLKTCTGKEILFGKPDYYYYVLTDKEWDSNDYTLYKKATISNGKITLGETLNKSGNPIDENDITTITDSGYTFKTTSTWGDYELDLSIEVDGPANDITDYIHLKDTEDAPGTVIYGVVMTAISEDGAKYDYPLRHIENVWSVNELGWNVGFSETVHDTKVQSNLYKSLPGQSISYVTYYTNSGVYRVQLCDKEGNKTSEKVLKKYNIATPETILVSDGKAALTLTDAEGKPVIFTPSVTVDTKLAGGAYQDGTITWTADRVLPGSYTVDLKDEQNEYAELSTSLVLCTNTAAAVYDPNSKKLVAAGGSSDENLANFIKNIATVNVNGTDYVTSGRGAATIIKSDGSIDWEATSSRTGAIFANAGEYKFEISSAGYPSVSFTATKNKADSSVTLSDKTVAYNGSAVAIDAAKVTGSTGKVTYKYYSDSACTKEVAAANVKNAGTYYVKATVAEDSNYNAATSTAAKLVINPAASSITLSNKTVTYTGRAVPMSGARVTGSTGKVTYKYYSDSACTKEVAAANVKNAGTYYVKATVAADNNYKTDTSSAAKLTVKAAAQKITCKKATASYKASALKLKKKTFKIGASAKGKGKITYKKASNKNLSVSSKGVVTVKKGLNKGTYTIKVKITAAKKGNYAKTTATKTIKVKVTK